MRTRAVATWIGLALMVSVATISHAGSDDGLPRLSLRNTGDVVAERYGKRAINMQPPVFIQSKDASFDLRVTRASYKDPLVLNQVLHTSGGDQWVELGGDHVESWRGLEDFTRVIVRDSEGKVVYSAKKRFCPNNWDRQRVDDLGPSRPTFPTSCSGSLRSFLRGAAWGLDQGWAVPLVNGVRLDLAPGAYDATVRITRDYRELFGVARTDAVTHFGLEIKKVPRPDYEEWEEFEGSSRTHHPSHAPGEDSAGTLGGAGVPSDPSMLPDLAALPAFRMRIENERSGKSRLEFAATVWTGGPSPLVVEGFRRDGEDTMDAYQYFYDGDEAVGRAPVGTFEYDRRDGHFHWHFQQFARYQIRSVETGEVVRSSKQSFCVVPTTAIDLSLDNASRDTERANLSTSCGGSEALWIREVLPVGWGDTYSQVAGQAFNVTSLPNGEYWVEVEANPQGLLYEQNPANNLVRRKVTLKGKRGDRDLTAWNWHGIDF
ncbi:MAG: lysyl oxidase family protein [Actinomycetota bacterium]|nr:lysyl oxidase family protein [Actinomycetota bacterium]